jgi:hypothetical protein
LQKEDKAAIRALVNWVIVANYFLLVPKLASKPQPIGAACLLNFSQSTLANACKRPNACNLDVSEAPKCSDSKHGEAVSQDHTKPDNAQD